MMFNSYNQGYQNRNQQPQTQTPSKQPNANSSSSTSNTSTSAQNGVNNSTSDERFNNNPKLNGIDPLKLKIIMEIKNKSKDKSMEELLPEIMKVNQELNRRNMAFTKKETDLLLEIIEESLSPEEKPKFNMLKGFMGM